jgi:tripartite-type tricarboxylate transporter receptor subunit TctC
LRVTNSSAGRHRAPAATGTIVERLYREIAALLATDEARAWFASYGLEPGGESPVAFAELMQTEDAKWGPLIRAAGIKAE